MAKRTCRIKFRYLNPPVLSLLAFSLTAFHGLCTAITVKDADHESFMNQANEGGFLRRKRNTVISGGINEIDNIESAIMDDVRVLNQDKRTWGRKENRPKKETLDEISNMLDSGVFLPGKFFSFSMSMSMDTMEPTKKPSTKPPLTPKPSTKPPITPEPTKLPTTSVPTSSPTPLNCSDPTTRANLITTELIKISGIDALSDPSSPQFLAAEWIIFNDPLQVNPCEYPTLGQRYALAVIAYATNSDSWLDNSAWLSAAPECSWFGITCDNGEVDIFDLSNNNLSGILPPEVSELKIARVLTIAGNSVSGSMPTEIGSLSELIVLDVESNRMEGEFFFDELFDMNNLLLLLASNNRFAGSIPGEDLSNFSNLRQLLIGNNRFEGTIPSEIGFLTEIEKFYGYNNFFSGPIPNTIGQLELLQELDLSDNSLDGELPQELYGLGDMERLLLCRNKLFGEISGSIGDMTSLTDLWLDNNDFNGEIPGEITNLLNLENLLLEGNEFSGEIPNNIGNLAQLNFTNLAGNNLRGPIPAGLFTPNLRFLYLSNNTLTGEIPNEISNAELLQDLYLDGNLLVGEIPEIPSGTLQNLEEFLLNGNDLSGEMPSSICNLRDNSATPGSLILLYADCASPPDPPDIICEAECCTRCFAG